MTGSQTNPGFPAPADLAAPDLRRLIMRMALPSVVGLSVNAAHHTANAVFVGMAGVEAIAAVTVAFPIVVIIAAVGEGLGVGAAAAIGRLLGARRPAQAGAVASTAVAIAIPIGALMTLALSFWREPLLALFGATPDVMPPASVYLGVAAFGATLILLQILSDFIAIAEGNTRFSMWTLIGGFALNVALDPLLIFGLGLGVAGAALATILSQLAVLAVYAVYFARRVGVVHVTPRLVSLRRRVVGPVFAIGTPAALATMLTGAAFALLYRSAGAHGGEAAIAGVGVALRVFTLGLLPIYGFALGAQAVLSFAWGAGDVARLRKATRFMLAVATAASAAYALAVMLFADPLAGLFTDDPAARAMAARAIVLIHAPFPLLGLRLVLLALLQAMDRPKLSAVVSLAPQGYLLIPALALLPARFGFDGVAGSLTASSALANLMALVLVAYLFRALRDRPSVGPNAYSPAPS